MKKILILLLSILLVSCGSDDDGTNTFEITLDEVGVDRVEISWSIPTQSNYETIYYRILLNGNEIASDLTVRNYLITGLSGETTYTVTVISLDDTGDSTFAEATFTTERDTFLNAVLTLTTQAQVDAFDYTGVHTLELIGNDISDISNLQQLTRVLNKIVIKNTSLQNLDGFSNLISDEYAAKTIDIRDNPQLESISGLNQFAHDAAFFYLVNNPNVSSLNGFLLRPIMANLVIDDVQVTNFSNFSNVQNVTIELKINNTPLSSTGGFNNLTYAQKIILNNVSENLTNSFTSLNRVSSLVLRNITIQNLNMFTNVTDCFGLTLEDMPQMMSLQGFENNPEFRALNLIGNTQPDISVWLNSAINNNLKRLDLNNTPHTDLSMLSSMQAIHHLSITNTDLITDYSGLDNMGYISSISVGNCSSFNSFAGALWSNFNNEMSITITNNPNLTNFCELQPNLESNGIYFNIGSGTFNYQVSGNAYNPTMEEIVTPEGCSQ